METVDNKQTSVHFCGMCGKVFQRHQTKNMPFCSKRCQQLDLAGWLDEKYGLPYEGDSPSTISDSD